MAEQKNYYAIIPANVRYDKELKPNAKLLYGEITALCNETGECWAGNEYFSKLYDVRKDTISKWVNQLAKKQYIYVEIIYKKDSKEIEKRSIKIFSHPIDKKANTLLAKKPIPIDKKAKENNTINNIYIYTENSELQKTLIDFTEMRASMKLPLTENSLKLIFKKLDRLAKSDEEKIQILENSIINNWKSVFQPKEEQKAVPKVVQPKTTNKFNNFQQDKPDYNELLRQAREGRTANG